MDASVAAIKRAMNTVDPDYPMAACSKADLRELLASVESLSAEKAALEKELADAKAVVTEANNSLYGSQGYFLTCDGGEPDKHHLARPIEELKARSNREWKRAESLSSQLAEARGALEDATNDLEYLKHLSYHSVLDKVISNLRGALK